MPGKCNKILDYDQGQKSKRILYIFYADTQSLFKKILICTNNPENSARLQNVVIQYWHSVHLMLKIVNMINTEEKTVWKDFLKI